MGVACKIIRNPNNTIDVVEAPNGEFSTLFSNLLSHTNNEEKALDLWTLPYTIGFNEVNGDWQNGESTLKLDSNGEPTMKDVLNYSKFIRNEGKRLSNEQLASLANNLYSLPINDFNSLYSEIRSTFYKNGVFEINKEALDKSLLYNELEVLDIIANPKIQNQIKDIVERIETEYLSENGTKFNELLSTYYFQDEDLIFDKSKTVGIGKYKALNPFEVSDLMSSYLGGITNRNTFDNKIKDLPFPSIVARYQSDTNFANELYNRFSKLTPVPVYKEIDGDLTNRLNNETFLTMQETLVADVNNEDIVDNVVLLRNIDNTLWEDNISEVQLVLKEIETSLVDANIDVIGLANSTDNKSQEQVMEFINSLESFTTDLNFDLVTPEALRDMANQIDSYFDTQKVEETLYTKVDLNNTGKALLSLTPVSSEIELFKTQSLIKTVDGLYHKVNVIQDTNNLYETVYSLVQQDNLLLPKEAFYPTAYNANDVFNRSKLSNAENKPLIINDIRRFVNRKMAEYNTEIKANQMDSLEKLLIYKMLFKHPINVTEGVDLDTEFNNILNFNGDTNYLLSDFISEFYNYKLVNKLENNELYQNVLRHFSVDERGIILTNDDLHTKQQIRLVAPDNTIFKDLKQYSYLTKDKSFKGLFITEPSTKDDLNDNEFKRQYYINNSNEISIFAGNFDTDGDLLITNNITDDFIRTKEGLYEKIQEHGNAVFYRELPTVSNPYFNTYDKSIRVDKNVDVNKYSHYINQQDASFTKSNNLYSRKELESINERIDECG